MSNGNSDDGAAGVVEPTSAEVFAAIGGRAAVTTAVDRFDGRVLADEALAVWYRERNAER